MASRTYVVFFGVLAILSGLVLPAMSHNAVIDRGREQENLQHILSATSQPERPRSVVKGTTESKTIGVKVVQGRLVFEFAKICMGETAMKRLLAGEAGFRLLGGFWPACCRQSFGRVCTDATRKNLTKALQYHITSLKKGAITVCGMFRDKTADQKRWKVGSQNSTKCPELGELLYDWFIDTLQIYHARTDQPLFLPQARCLSQRLLQAGYGPAKMPNLEGEAGNSWFHTWRKRKAVVIRKTVKHQEVSYANLKQRVQVIFKNISALRFLWRICFGEVEMRWVSWDEKPAWFNNIAVNATYSIHGYEPQIKGIEARARQRFTICTCVDSAAANDDADPPPVGMLFEAAARGRVWQELTND